MTARARKVLDSLPQKVLTQIQRLSKSLGESPEIVVERAVQLFDEQQTKKSMVTTSGKRQLVDLSTQAGQAQLKQVMGALGSRSAKNRSPEKQNELAVAGGHARAEALDAATRKKIASAAAKARWAKKHAEDKKTQ